MRGWEVGEEHTRADMQETKQKDEVSMLNALDRQPRTMNPGRTHSMRSPSSIKDRKARQRLQRVFAKGMDEANRP